MAMDTGKPKAKKRSFLERATVGMDAFLGGPVALSAGKGTLAALDIGNSAEDLGLSALDAARKSAEKMLGVLQGEQVTAGQAKTMYEAASDGLLLMKSAMKKVIKESPRWREIQQSLRMYENVLTAVEDFMVRK